MQRYISEVDLWDTNMYFYHLIVIVFCGRSKRTYITVTNGYRI